MRYRSIEIHFCGSFVFAPLSRIIWTTASVEETARLVRGRASVLDAYCRQPTKCCRLKPIVLWCSACAAVSVARSYGYVPDRVLNPDSTMEHRISSIMTGASSAHQPRTFRPEGFHGGNHQPRWDAALKRAKLFPRRQQERHDIHNPRPALRHGRQTMLPQCSRSAGNG